MNYWVIFYAGKWQLCNIYHSYIQKIFRGCHYEWDLGLWFINTCNSYYKCACWFISAVKFGCQRLLISHKRSNHSLICKIVIWANWRSLGTVHWYWNIKKWEFCCEPPINIRYVNKIIHLNKILLRLSALIELKSSVIPRIISLLSIYWYGC